MLSNNIITIIIVIIIIIIIFILVNVLVAGRASETRRTATLMIINEVDALLELGTSHSLAVVNVLLGEGQIEAKLCTLGKFVPKHTQKRIDKSSGQI